ncbi:MAG: D-glucuronyl C5-epimerase family protein [Paracoccaceae bacterium]
MIDAPLQQPAAYLVDQTATEMNPFNPPELPQIRHLIYEYYRLVIGPDGCPMRLMPDGRQVFHPILIPYLVLDHLKAYGISGSRASLDYARFVMDCALQRAEPGCAPLLFYYEPESGLSQVPQRFYSALTQSWYLRALARLELHFPGRYTESLQRAWASLNIPIEEGGVLLRKDFGWIVEEYPHEPPLYTLNGWLTALRWVLGELAPLKKAGIDPMEFLRRNLDAVEHLLPIYDAGFCNNTRYQLTGFTRMRLVSDRPVGLACTGLQIAIKGEAPITVDLTSAGKSGRWASFLEKQDERSMQFNVLQSVISAPEPNRYSAKLTCTTDCRVKVLMADGGYDPNLTAMPTTNWREIREHDLTAGENLISGEITSDGKDMFSYPTNFKKKLGDLYHNAYHFIHVMDLAILYRETGRVALADMALKWLDYIDHWPKMEELRRKDINLRSYGYQNDEFRTQVHNYLDAGPKRQL